MAVFAFSTAHMTAGGEKPLPASTLNKLDQQLVLVVKKSRGETAVQPDVYKFGGRVLVEIEAPFSGNCPIRSQAWEGRWSLAGERPRLSAHGCPLRRWKLWPAVRTSNPCPRPDRLSHAGSTLVEKSNTRERTNMKSGNAHFELMSKLIRTQRVRARMALLAVLVLVVAAVRPASALNINLTFDTDANLMAAGLTATDIANMKAACASAATQFTSRYSDPINVNIKVTSSPGTNDLGSSSAALDPVDSYATLRNAAAADAKTADDTTTVGAGGSLRAGADPITTAHMYNVTRAQAKALGLRPDDMQNDGSFNFGGGNKWTYDPNNRNVAGSFDFIGVAMHEYTEIMGRTSIMGDTLGTGTPIYIEFDLFHYTGPGARGLNNGPNRFFSFDNGTSLLIAFNDAVANPGSDLQDWAGPAPDSFNAAGPTGEQDDLTPVDLQVMDVIGYDRGTAATTPAQWPISRPDCRSALATICSLPDLSSRGRRVRPRK